MTYCGASSDQIINFIASDTTPSRRFSANNNTKLYLLVIGYYLENVT